MKLSIHRIIPHPDNPNTMSKPMLQQLAAHIESAGRYPPLIVRTLQGSKRFARHRSKYQLIDGHQRLAVLNQLGHKTAEVQNWGPLTDHQADILLLTLKRLAGNIDPTKRAKLLKRVLDQQKLTITQLAKLLPDSQTTLQRLLGLTKPTPRTLPKPPDPADQPIPFAVYLNAKQNQLLQKALKKARTQLPDRTTKNTAHLVEQIVKNFLKNHT